MTKGMRLLSVFIIAVVALQLWITQEAWAATTRKPTKAPTVKTKKPTRVPSAAPTRIPVPTTFRPTTLSPTRLPTSGAPTRIPSAAPTRKPTPLPTKSPTKKPSNSPSRTPSATPTISPTTTALGYFFTLRVSNVNLSIIAPATQSPQISTSSPTSPTTRSPAVPTLSPTNPTTARPVVLNPTRAPTLTPTPPLASGAPTRRPVTLSPVTVGRRLRGEATDDSSYERDERQLQAGFPPPVVVGQTRNVPKVLANLTGPWVRLRESLHCLVDYVLDLKDVDLLALRLFFQVITVTPGCTFNVSFTQASSCFPMTLLVGVLPKEPNDLRLWSGKNVSSFTSTLNLYLSPLSIMGNVTATQNIGGLGVKNWPGSLLNSANNIFDVFGNNPTICRDVYLNQSVRGQIEARNPSLSPSLPSNVTHSPVSNATASDGGADNAGLVAGLVTFFLLCIAGAGCGYYYYITRKRAAGQADQKDPLLASGQKGGGDPNLVGPTILNSALKKNSRFLDPASSQSMSSGHLQPISSVVSNATSGEFDFSIDLSRLKLGKVIGHGANGRIFAARYSGSDVAVKELFAYQDTDDEYDGESKNSPALVIKREFDNLRRLKHPHIIQLFGLAYARSAETGSPRYLLVMELAEISLDKVLTKRMHKFEMETLSGAPGASLTISSVSTAEQMNVTRSTNPDGTMATTPASMSRPPWSPSQPPPAIHPMTDPEHLLWALDIARQIAAGLSFVHERDMIHFDVKPHNILLDKAGMVKICDLGISKMVSKQSDLTLTSPGRAGTPSYMAPELLRQDVKLIGTPVDVYAFGIVLWQLLHLRPPHPKEWSIAQLFDHVLHKAHRPQVDPQLDESTAKLIEQCWQENPTVRPNFIEIIKDIDDIATLAQPDKSIEELPDDKLKEATFVENEKVQVFSAAVGLVKGVVTGIRNEGGKTFYDVMMEDGSTLVDVRPADLVPLKKNSGHSSEERNGPARLDTLDPKNATIGDLAAALAIGRADERRRGRRGRRASQVESGSNTILPPSIAGFQRSGPLVSNSPKGNRTAMMRFGKRIWKSKEHTLSPTSREDVTTPDGPKPSSPPTSPTSLGATGATGSGILSLDVGQRSTAMMNMPALTPFSLRFLHSDDDSTISLQTKSLHLADDVAANHGSLLSQTFRYNGAVLEMKGLLVSEGGLTPSMVMANRTGISEETSGTKYAGKLFKIAELGHGASGNVHSALHDETFEVVAVKEVKFLSDRAARHQTVRELRALQNLRHPNVVQFKAAFLDPVSECVCIVLEYVLGGSLQDLIELSSSSSSSSGGSSGFLSTPSGPLPPRPPPVSLIPNSIINEEILRRIAFDLSSALAYCHEKLIAHLDVKPSNILLTLSGSAKLADFGLARTFSEASNVHAATFVGTTKYMSPERLKGESYSFPADIWGLGLSLGAAALGRFPIDLPQKGDSQVFFALLEKVKAGNDIIALPTSRFSSEAINFVISCVALSPEARPRADELLTKFDWMRNVPDQPQSGDKTASQVLMTEIAEVVGQRLVEIESRAPSSGGPSRVIEVRSALVTNLAAQLNLSEKDVRLELETVVAKFSALATASVLSDTMNSRSSRESKSSRFALSDAGGSSMKKAGGVDQLSDTISSLLNQQNLGKSPSDMSRPASVIGAERVGSKESILSNDDVNGDDDDGEGLELLPM